MSPVLPSRRALLAGALALVTVSARAETGSPRVAALDWTLASACLSLGIVPAGVAEQRLYTHWVQDPALPASVAELGLRTAPSLEGLAALEPDLILINALDEPLRARLERIAPTLSLSIYGPERRPLALAAETLRDLARRFGREAEAEAVIAGSERGFARCAAALAGSARPPVVVFAFEDARHIRVYGQGSLFADVLGRLGLSSGWTGATSAWGTALAGIDAVASLRDTMLVAVDPIPADARALIAGDGLWAALSAGRSSPLVTLPPVWAYGEVGAARRFADLLTPALLSAEARHGS
ncbi:MAG: ABC transporter substrate-binding protein [Janthinobacterium lividum]